MVQVSYDDTAASFFGITVLVLYLVPALIHIYRKERRLKAPVQVNEVSPATLEGGCAASAHHPADVPDVLES